MTCKSVVNTRVFQIGFASILNFFKSKSTEMPV